MSESNIEIENLYQAGKINEFFYNKLKRNSWIFPSNLLGTYLQEAVYMSSLGISSLDDQNILYSIMQAVPDVMDEILEDKLELTTSIQSVIDLVFKNRSQYPINSTFDVFCAVSKAAQQLGLPLKPNAINEIDESCSLNKKAYPQGYTLIPELPVYNVDKWMQATREIYAKMNRESKSFDQSEGEVTSQWDKMEKMNYKYWIKFYNEGVPQKYPKLATAQFNPNFLQELKSELPKPLDEIERLEEKRKAKEKERLSDVNNVRVRIEDHRNKLVSRLNSAEKLLASMDGQFFAGDDQEIMLKLLQDLKRKVQISNKINLKSSLFEDFIYRTGNMLKAQGATPRAYNFFYKLAQVPASDDPFAAMDPFAAGATPPDPSLDPTAVPAEDAQSLKDDTKQAFREFAELLDRGIYDSNDDTDENKVIASQDIIITAQLMDVPPEAAVEEIPIGSSEVAPQSDKPKQNRPKQELGPEDLIVEPPINRSDIEPDGDDDVVVVVDDETDDVIEAALAYVTPNDAIQRLEMLLSIYKQREIPRQLSILDLMLDKLGLSSMFPQLGEAQTKALDAGGYITSRLEEILSALKGSALSEGANDWVSGTNTEYTPQEKAIQEDIQRKNKLEKDRREMRKQQSDAKLDAASNVSEKDEQDLAQPAQVAPVASPIAVR